MKIDGHDDDVGREKKMPAKATTRWSSQFPTNNNFKKEKK